MPDAARDEPPSRHVLIVCTANQCRSPMAEGLLRLRLARCEPAPRLAVASAGTWAQADRPATENAIRTLAERGYDLTGHRSREVTAQALVEADLVLVMTADHQAALEAEFPAARGKTLRMSELGGGGWDVADPVGEPLAAYRATAEELDRLIGLGWARILGEVA
jgi:protein-tyrosine-phosphatase